MTEQICTAVRNLTQTVADFIRAEADNFDATSAVSDKSYQNLVSYVDKTAEERLVAGLLKIIPDAQILAEEGTVAPPSDSPYTWIIDPLDGTTNFVHGLPFFSISIALLHQNTLVLGIVHEVVRNEVFYAWKGSSAFLNGKIIGVSPSKSLNDALIATGFPYYKFDKAEAYLRIFNDLMRKTRGIRRLGSAALDLAYVACGRFDAYFEYNLQTWDIAAGAFIVQQAGGKVVDFENNAEKWLDGSSILATNGHLDQEMHRHIAEYWLKM